MKKFFVIGAAALAVVALPATADAHSWNDSRRCGISPNHLGILAVGPTSCAFARNTVRAFRNMPTGQVARNVYAPFAATRRVWSPVTHRWYRMHGYFWMRGPAGWHYHITGGNGAHVDLVS